MGVLASGGLLPGFPCILQPPLGGRDHAGIWSLPAFDAGFQAPILTPKSSVSLGRHTWRSSNGTEPIRASDGAEPPDPTPPRGSEKGRSSM